MELIKVLGPFFAATVPLIAAFFLYQREGRKQAAAAAQGQPALVALNGALTSERGMRDLIGAQKAHTQALNQLREQNVESAKALEDAMIRIGRSLEEIAHIMKTRN